MEETPTSADDLAAFGRLVSLQEIAEALGLSAAVTRGLLGRAGAPGRITVNQRVHRWREADVVRFLHAELSARESLPSASGLSSRITPVAPQAGGRRNGRPRVHHL